MLHTLISIDGKSILDFLNYFTSIEGTSKNDDIFKTTGACINGLLANNLRSISDASLWNERYCNPAWLPPTVEVVFDDASMDLWEACVVISGKFDLTKMQEQISAHCTLYMTMEVVIGKANARPVTRAEKTTMQITTVSRSSTSSSSKSNLALRIAGEIPAAGNIWMSPLLDDCIVKKISIFSGTSLDTVTNARNLVVQDAKTKGYSKSLLDLNKNNGGSIVADYTLSICMAPSAS